MFSDPVSTDELDSLIWHFLRDCDGQPANSVTLDVATGGNRCRIKARIQAMRKAGRIRHHRGPRGANPNRPAHVRDHGWEPLGCPGAGVQENGQFDWSYGCADCQRRVRPDPADGVVEPPPIVAFECELRIEP